MKSLAADYPEIEVRTYTAGKDMEYIPKYGMLMQSALILNESKMITDISKTTIRQAFETVVKDAQCN